MTDREEIREAVAEILKHPREHITDGVGLLELVRESLILVELVIEVQERFGARFGHEDLRKVETFADLADLILRTQMT